MTHAGAVVAVEEAFWDDRDAVGACLREPVARIPPWFGYDERGSELFEEITELPTYYLTRVERDLLHRHSEQIAELIDCARLAELGSGSAKKTQLLLAACQRRRSTTYLPIDVSREMLRRSGAELRTAIPGLRVTGLWGRYEAGLARLREAADPVVVAFFGSNLGNTTPTERDTLLAAITATLRAGDGFLVSVDLIKPAAQFDRCYNDPPGFSAFARFRLNHLTHLNRRFGSAFDLATFVPTARYDPAAAVVEGHLVATSDQRVPVPGLGLTLALRQGEVINVGFSAKFDRDEFIGDVGAHGLAHQAEWIDPDQAYGIFLFRR
ncbi:MAG: L-histidine N(alpha)-methyltransferase [Actinomycetota bacterium]|nr:L-histidine N(alpha)-methyltransferase [Actinomycetota bacterium]